MKKIDELTPEQEEVMIEFRKKWFAIGSSCEPADRSRAEVAITAMYERIGKSAPRFVWTGGPATALILQAEIDAGGIAELSDTYTLGNLLSCPDDQAIDRYREVAAKKNVTKYLGREWWGSMEVYWIAYYLYAHEHLGVEYERQADLDLWSEIAQSCGWWWPYDNICICIERPERIVWELDAERPRLHCDDGPALRYREGWEIYSWHGVRVEPRIILDPESITVKEIADQHNQEIRRVLLDRYGMARYIEDSGMKLVSEDEYGQLYQEEKQLSDDDELLTMVLVRDATPYADGSRREYVLTVPSDMTTAHQAVAWTFRLTPDEYHPEIEA